MIRIFVVQMPFHFRGSDVMGNFSSLSLAIYQEHSDERFLLELVEIKILFVRRCPLENSIIRNRMK